jgi:hypothetical protein
LPIDTERVQDQKGNIRVNLLKWSQFGLKFGKLVYGWS